MSRYIVITYWEDGQQRRHNERESEVFDDLENAVFAMLASDEEEWQTAMGVWGSYKLVKAVQELDEEGWALGAVAWKEIGA